jgi:penicillin-binding protein 2
MQCVQGPYYKELSEKNRIRLLSLSAPRGNIYDRKGNLLAGSKIAFDCAIIPQEFKADEKKLKELSSILQIQPASLQKKIKENVAAPFIPAILKKDIGKETAISISERSIDYPGLIIHTYPKRYYPNGRIGSSLIGYLGRINQKELDALRDYGYKPIDFVGRGGLELSYDNYLKGDDGGMQTEVDSMGRELRVLGIREPEKGRDITVTVDLDLERYVDSLFEGHSGAVIVMDSSSGGILALASKPDFDPNIFVSSSEPSLIRKLLKRTDYPFVNRSISGAYPPGSTFKIVTASAALESGRVSGTDHFGCKGYYVVGNRRFNCWREEGHKLQTMAEGIKNSCNVFFYQVGRKAGVDELSAYASLYGFGSLSGIDLPYEAEGVVPSRAWKRHNKKEMWYEGDTVNFAIGQGYLLVTPIQILRMINVIATEGELVKPFIVKSIDSVEVFTAEKKGLDISNNTCKLIKEGARKAVEDNNGTAFRARAEGLKIAGKTGTAQTGAKNTHAWFAGFSPIESPKVSLVIFLEHGGKGGNKPSRMASGIFTKLKELGYL